MRNLLEYPITSTEVLAVLQVTQEENSAKKMIGSITGLSLLYAEEFIKANEEQFKKFLVDTGLKVGVK